MNKPNILLIHADQHRQDCLGCYGNPDVKTPNIDALARDGTRYTEHFTVYPVCTPSRYSMLSGLYAHQHCALSNETTLPDGFATFPKLLRQNGYRTAAVGKMHFTPTYQDVGFDRMVLAEQNGLGRYEDDYHAWLRDCGLVDSVDLTDQVDEHRARAGKDYYESFGATESDLDCEHHSTTWITGQALNEIEGWDPRGGNLLMVGYIKPHHPFDPPAPYSTLYDPARVQIPAGYTPKVPETDYEYYPGFFDNRTLHEEQLRRVIALYYGTITQIDDGVGRLVSRLKEKGIYNDTLIVYTSDHGEYLGFHHMLLKSNALYDPLERLPLIIKYPGANEKQVDESLSENIDLCSTLLAACNIAPAESMCGRDLQKGEKREFVFAEFIGGKWGQNYMIRSRDYKLMAEGSLDRLRFFDLKKDPLELTDEAGNPIYKEEINRHLRALADKMLFSAAAKPHCDKSAPQRADQKELNARTEALLPFISGRFSQR